MIISDAMKTIADSIADDAAGRGLTLIENGGYGAYFVEGHTFRFAAVWRVESPWGTSPILNLYVQMTLNYNELTDATVVKERMGEFLRDARNVLARCKHECNRQLDDHLSALRL